MNETACLFLVRWISFTARDWTAKNTNSSIEIYGKKCPVGHERSRIQNLVNPTKFLGNN